MPVSAFAPSLSSLIPSLLPSASHTVRSSLTAPARAIATVFNGVADQAAALSPSTWLPSSFWGRFPVGALCGDTGDTGCLEPLLPEVPAPHVPSVVGEFFNSAGTYLQGFANDHVPAIVGTAALGAALYVGNKFVDRYTEKFQADPKRSVNQKNFAQAAFRVGKVFAVSTAIAAASYAWGVETTMLSKLLGTGLITSALFFGNQAMSKYTSGLVDDKGLSSDKKDLYQSGIVAARFGSVGLAALMAAQLWGMELGELATTVGFLGAAATLAIRDLIANIVGWGYLVSSQIFTTGDEIEFDGKKGIVESIGRFGVTNIRIAGVDGVFDEVIHHIPPSKVLGQTVTILKDKKEIAEHKERIVDKIKIGDHVSVGDKIGQVTAITQRVMRVETYDAARRPVITNYFLSDLNGKNFTNYGQNPPSLTFKYFDGNETVEVTIGIGDTITIGAVTGSVKGYSLDTVVVDDGEKLHFIGRTSLAGASLPKNAPPKATGTVATEANPSAA